MDIYSVPERYERALRELVALSDAKIERLCSALTGLPLDLFPGERLAKELAEVLSVTTEAAREPAELLLSLYFRLSKSGQDVRSAAEDVIDSLPSRDPDAASGASSQQWVDNLTRLLSVDSLYVQQNATGLLYERSSLFTDARVLTDIRPVFGKDVSPSQTPKAFLIVHTLRVSYSNAGGDEDIFLAMDAEDLDRLSKLIDRARAKESVLKSVIGITKIPIIETGTEE